MNSQHVRDDVAGEEIYTFSLFSKSLSPMTALFRMLLLNLLVTFFAFPHFVLFLQLLKVTSAYLSGSRTVVANRVFFSTFSKFSVSTNTCFLFSLLCEEKKLLVFSWTTQIGEKVVGSLSERVPGAHTTHCQRNGSRVVE